MRRLFPVLALLFVLAGCLPAVAAAASPTASTGGATSIADTSVVLHGRVNPNAIQTGYVFDYGTTAGLGLTSAARSVGHGNRGVNVAEGVAGLIPGTVYYYRIDASSAAGTALGVTRHFITTGAPPPAVVTGAAVNVGKTVATPTGAVNSSGALTYWQVQYGLTSAYGLETTFAPLSPIVTVALPVSAQISGLAPATLFHYRIVALHSGGTAQVGADGTFFTEPARRPAPSLAPRTSPSSDTKSPYTFTTTGTLKGASFIPAVDRCTGKVGVRYYNGRRQLAVVAVPVGGDCRFSATATFRRTHGKGAVRLRITVDYRGNGYLAPVSRTNHVTAG